VALSIVMRRLPGGTVEIAPRGEIDVDCAHEVREAVAVALSRHQPTAIELNMRRVTFIDSVGISAMVSGFQTAEVSGVKLTVTEPSRFVHRQLWVTGLLGLFGAPQPYQPDGDRDARPAAPGDIDG
jgi:anti-sigma B factor antagonist